MCQTEGFNHATNAGENVTDTEYTMKGFMDLMDMNAFHKYYTSKLSSLNWENIMVYAQKSSYVYSFLNITWQKSPLGSVIFLIKITFYMHAT